MYVRNQRNAIVWICDARRQFYVSDEYKVRSYYYCVYLMMNMFCLNAETQIANKVNFGSNDINRVL